MEGHAPLLAMCPGRDLTPLLLSVLPTNSLCAKGPLRKFSSACSLGPLLIRRNSKVDVGGADIHPTHKCPGPLGEGSDYSDVRASWAPQPGGLGADARRQGRECAVSSSRSQCHRGQSRLWVTLGSSLRGCLTSAMPLTFSGPHFPYSERVDHESWPRRVALRVKPCVLQSISYRPLRTSRRRLVLARAPQAGASATGRTFSQFRAGGHQPPCLARPLLAGSLHAETALCLLLQ